jgi:hypothetical protein
VKRSEWYLDDERYWISDGETNAYPLRQGDLIACPENSGLGWLAAQIVHPSCELEKPSMKQVQVARVRPLSDLADDFSKQLVMAGFREGRGRRQVAVVHTFFLAPWPEGSQPCFVNFREMSSIDRESISTDSRIAAMTHDCRVAWIRRWIHFRLRLTMSTAQVREMEAQRIGNDPRFEGPRPEWAPLAV